MMSDLVKKLSERSHDVELTVHPPNSQSAFKECLDDGYVHVRFPNTNGGTTLGVRLDRERTDASAADFGGGTGRVVLSGTLTLDYVPVVCHAEIDLATLKGTGRLEVVVH
jgi:hypothetical protein